MRNDIVNKCALLLFSAAIMTVSCTKLDTKLKDPDSQAPSSTGGAPTPSSLSKVYEQLNQLSNNQGNWFAMEEHTTDELMGPTPERTGMILVHGENYIFIPGTVLTTR